MAEASPSAKQKLTREARLDLLVKLIKGKGPAAVAQVQQRISAGQELSAKGITWDVGMLKEALARSGSNTTSKDTKPAIPQPRPAAPIHSEKDTKPAAPQLHPAVPASAEKAHPLVPTPVRAPLSTNRAPAATSAPAAALPSTSASVTLPRSQPTPAASSGSSSRWSVAAPTAEAIARKAQMESEHAETFIHTAKNAGENKVAVLMKPNVLSQPTGEYVMPGESVEVVARLSRIQDGRTYLRLKKSTGWVCTRSRKDYWKVVIGSCNGGTALEPASFPTEFLSHAARMLQRVNEEGAPVDERGKPLEAKPSDPPEAKKFRVVSGRSQPILGTPDLQSTQHGAMLQAKEEFAADAVCVMASDGRAYLRLQDGRGWVSERLKADFNRYAIEPAGHPHAVDLDLPRARRSSVMRQTTVEAQDARGNDQAGDAAEEVPYEKPARGPSLKVEAVVFRSDESLWPKAHGQPRPLTSDQRVTLRRLANNFKRKIDDCEKDLKEVEARVESFTRKCESKTMMEAHADSLRKESAKYEKAWQKAVEEAVAGMELSPVKESQTSKIGARVSPVLVLGNTWYCAIVNLGNHSGEDAGDGLASRRWGPLRTDASSAAEDLRALEAALEHALENGGLKPAARPVKKRRTSKVVKEVEEEEAADEEEAEEPGEEEEEE